MATSSALFERGGASLAAISGLVMRAVSGNRDLRESRPTAHLLWGQGGPASPHRRVIDAVAMRSGMADCLGFAVSIVGRQFVDAGHDIVALELPDVPPAAPLLRGFASVGDGAYVACEHRFWRSATLPLADGDDAFLASLGYGTRRNIRNYRRKADAEGLRFHLALAPPSRDGRDERHRLGQGTRPAPRSPRTIDRLDAFLRREDRPFTGRLLGKDGACEALVAGFVAESSAYVAYQVHRHDPKLSTSLLVRSLLAKALIDQRIVELVFPNGAAGLLGACCEREAVSVVTLVRSSRAAMLRAGSLPERLLGHPASRVLRLAWDQGGDLTPDARVARIAMVARGAAEPVRAPV